MYKIRTAEELLRQQEIKEKPDLELVSEWLEWFDKTHLAVVLKRDVRIYWGNFPKKEALSNDGTRKRFREELRLAGFESRGFRDPDHPTQGPGQSGVEVLQLKRKGKD